MNRFPYWRFPYNYQYYMNSKSFKQNNSIANPNKICNTITNICETKSSTKSTNSEKPIFEIFGICLFFDDLIILCLLFFLYQENVKDEMLYIILFLLLFS